MGAVLVAKDSSLSARSVAVIGHPSSLLQERTVIALELEDCPGKEDLNILTNSLSFMRLLKSMQRGGFPLPLHQHPVWQLKLHVVKQLNRRAWTGRISHLIEFCGHRGEPLNEHADSLAAEAAESDPACYIALDQDPAAVNFSLNGTWVE